MRNWLIIFLVMLFIGVIPISCCLSDCDCGGGGEFSKKFNILSLKISTKDSSNVITDTSAYYAYNNAFKEISIDSWATAYLENQTGNIFINSAHACDPAPPVSAQNYASLKITSLTNISLYDTNDVKKDQDITDKFIIPYSSSNSTIESYITSRKNTGLYQNDSFIFRLEKKPIANSALKFNITITMTDGKVFNLDNQILKVF